MVKSCLLFKIFIFTIGIEILFIGSSSAYNLEEYYPLTEGITWVYSIIEDGEIYEEKWRIEGKERVNNVETVKNVYGEEYDCIAFDSEGMKLYKYCEEECYIYNPAEIIFPNIGIGESKSYSVKEITYNREGKKIKEADKTGQVKLESMEDVDISAGRFTDCLRFSSISERKKMDGGYNRDDCTIWLARGIGKVKESCVYVEYDVETRKSSVYIKTHQLISAVIDGKKIGGQ